MSVPVMLAAGGLSLLDLRHATGLSELIPMILVGFVTAAVVGYFSIRWMLGYLIHHSMIVFSIYCMVLGLLVLLVAYVL